jgi:hypothetical protein
VVDLDTTLDQQFLHIAVGQVEPQLPAHRDDDHLRRGTGTQRTPTSAAARGEDGSTASPVKPASILHATDATEPVLAMAGAYAGEIGGWALVASRDVTKVSLTYWRVVGVRLHLCAGT